MSTTPAQQDYWLTQSAVYETWPTERLQKYQRIFRGYLSDPLMQRNPRWLDRCIRPNLGLITITLLLRPAP